MVELAIAISSVLVAAGLAYVANKAMGRADVAIESNDKEFQAVAWCVVTFAAGLAAAVLFVSAIVALCSVTIWIEAINPEAALVLNILNHVK